MYRIQWQIVRHHKLQAPIPPNSKYIRIPFLKRLHQRRLTQKVQRKIKRFPRIMMQSNHTPTLTLTGKITRLPPLQRLLKRTYPRIRCSSIKNELSKLQALFSNFNGVIVKNSFDIRI